MDRPSWPSRTHDFLEHAEPETPRLARCRIQCPRNPLVGQRATLEATEIPGPGRPLPASPSPGNAPALPLLDRSNRSAPESIAAHPTDDARTAKEVSQDAALLPRRPRDEQR